MFVSQVSSSILRSVASSPASKEGGSTSYTSKHLSYSRTHCIDLNLRNVVFKQENRVAVKFDHGRPRRSIVRLAMTGSDQVTTSLDRPLDNIKDGDVIYTIAEQGVPMWLEVQHVDNIKDGFYASASGYDVLGKFVGEDQCRVEILGQSAIPEELFTRLRASLGLEVAKTTRELMGSRVSKVVQKGAGVVVGLSRVVESYCGLWETVKGDPDRWVAGGEEGGAQETAQAGEIIALIQGERGVVVVQLWTMKDTDAGNSLHNPLTLRAIREALLDKDIDIKLSLAATPAGNPIALSLMLHAKKAPFDSWATHLASLGVQSALIADTAEDKMLIGRILGYSLPNIQEHIVSRLQECTPEIVESVSKELTRISDAPPTLPWR